MVDLLPVPCPNCGGHTSVARGGSRRTLAGKRRVRTCQECGHTFTTFQARGGQETVTAGPVGRVHAPVSRKRAPSLLRLRREFVRGLWLDAKLLGGPSEATLERQARIKEIKGV